jgi:hypothetical protein
MVTLHKLFANDAFWLAWWQNGSDWMALHAGTASRAGVVLNNLARKPPTVCRHEIVAKPGTFVSQLWSYPIERPGTISAQAAKGIQSIDQDRKVHDHEASK